MIKSKVSGKRFLGVITDFWDYDAGETLRSAGIACSRNQDEKKIGRQMAIIKRIQGVQNVFKVNENTGLSKILVRENCRKILSDPENAKWEEQKDDDRPLAEIPKSKHLQSVFAIAHVVAFLSSTVGGDFYGLR